MSSLFLSRLVSSGSNNSHFCLAFFEYWLGHRLSSEVLRGFTQFPQTNNCLKIILIASHDGALHSSLIFFSETDPSFSVIKLIHYVSGVDAAPIFR
jgi:hypothetical protein